MPRGARGRFDSHYDKQRAQNSYLFVHAILTFSDGGLPSPFPLLSLPYLAARKLLRGAAWAIDAVHARVRPETAGGYTRLHEYLEARAPEGNEEDGSDDLVPIDDSKPINFLRAHLGRMHLTEGVGLHYWRQHRDIGLHYWRQAYPTKALLERMDSFTPEDFEQSKNDLHRRVDDLRDNLVTILREMRGEMKEMRGEIKSR